MDGFAFCTQNDFFGLDVPYGVHVFCLGRKGLE